MEKKPLYHFYPATTILSFGALGCNLQCGFCQNWEIAHPNVEIPLHRMGPEELVELALEAKREKCIGLAYTYNEPTVGFEFIYDTAEKAHQAGLKNVMVTNGEIGDEAREALLPLIDAWNIDVKAFDPETYRQMCGGPLEPVLRTVEEAAKTSHVEVTNLLIPGKNDDEAQIRGLVDWLADKVGKDTPLHFSRYFPRYKYREAPTPSRTLLMAHDLGREKLSYVYIGNAPELNGEDTLCPRCHRVVIEREGYQVRVHLDGKKCPYCGFEVAVVR